METTHSRTTYILLAVVSLGMLIGSYLYLTHHYTLRDQALFGSDTWEYQSIGVNLYQGHGYQFGELEKFSTYKFYLVGFYNPYIYRNHFRSHVGYSFYRAPGYPVMIGATYRFLGEISPLAVQKLQAFLMALAVSCIPWFGFFFWSKRGAVCGVAAGLIFVYGYAPNPVNLLTEPLLVMLTVIWAAFFSYWRYRPGLLSIGLLGLVTSILLLTKGVYAFLPFFVILYYGWREWPLFWFREKLYPVAVFGVTLLFPIAMWSGYASYHSPGVVILSTQGGRLLLDSNNEAAVYTGDWQPQWFDAPQGDKRYIYRRIKDSHGTMRKFLVFLWYYRSQIPRLMWNKLETAVGRRGSVFVGLTGIYYLFIALSLWCRRRSGSVGESLKDVPLAPAIFLANLGMIVFVFYCNERFIQVFLLFFILVSLYGGLSMAERLVRWVWKRDREDDEGEPDSGGLAR